MTLRTKVSPLTISYIERHKTHNIGAGWEEAWRYDTASEATESWMSGVDIANYHERRRKGELLPQTQFDQCFREVTVDPMDFTYLDASNPSFGSKYYNCGPSGGPVWTEWVPIPEVSDLSDLGSFHVQQASAAIYSQGFDALTALTEIKQLRSMMTGIVKRLGHLTRQRDSKSFADAWLEGRYGWRPLLYDIVDLNDAILNYDETRTRFSERKGESFTESSTNTSISYDGPHHFVTDTENIEHVVSVRGSVVADILPPRFQFNPVVTAWEKTHLSFVIDWLIDVGSALEAATFLIFQQKYAASFGWKIDTTYELTRSATDKGGTSTVHSGGSCSFTQTQVLEQRVPTSVSIIPQFKLRLDAIKVLDLLALVRQRI